MLVGAADGSVNDTSEFFRRMKATESAKDRVRWVMEPNVVPPTDDEFDRLNALLTQAGDNLDLIEWVHHPDQPMTEAQRQSVRDLRKRVLAGEVQS